MDFEIVHIAKNIVNSQDSVTIEGRGDGGTQLQVTVVGVDTRNLDFEVGDSFSVSGLDIEAAEQAVSATLEPSGRAGTPGSVGEEFEVRVPQDQVTGEEVELSAGPDVPPAEGSEQIAPEQTAAEERAREE